MNIYIKYCKKHNGFAHDLPECPLCRAERLKRLRKREKANKQKREQDGKLC